MGLKSLAYDQENLDAILEATKELEVAFNGLAKCITYPDESKVSDLIKHRSAYIDAKEKLEAAAVALIGPENLMDPDDIVVLQIQKELGEAPRG